jgi:SAM-dependent methyltransferase
VFNRFAANDGGAIMTAISESGELVVARAAVPGGAAPSTLVQAFAGLGVENRDEWGWDNYKRVVRHLAQTFGAHRMLEIGAGRSPLFGRDELRSLNAELTVNDISAEELAHLPPGYRQACFDIAGAVDASQNGSIDLAFSRMVFEHVEDAHKAWGNVHAILAPGGVALAFVPTLFALPFLINWLLPDNLGERIAHALDKRRTKDEHPVFPAHYNWCFTLEGPMRRRLESVGFDEILVQPFYGHRYYQRFPIIRDINRGFTALARKADLRLVSTYAYIAVRKRS